MYKYSDTAGNIFVSGKPRNQPLLKDMNQFECLLSCTKEALKLSKGNFSIDFKTLLSFTLQRFAKILSRG
jgi:hypothetical protein